MSARGVRAALGVLIGLVVLASAAADAANEKDKGVAYRWIDENGVVHYGDQVPPQYSTREQSVLNSQGVVVRQFEAQKTPEQLASDDRKQQTLLRQKQHDSFLLTTYTSVQDIEALRDVRIAQLHGQRAATEQYVESLHSRLTALQGRARFFRPYSARADAHRMPDDLAEDLVRTLNELRAQTDALAAKSEEEATVKAQFQADIERYQQLHVARPH